MTNVSVFGLGSYPARCLRVIDGDTLQLVVDVGFRLRMEGRFRLEGVDTPEMRSMDVRVREAGQRAMQFTATWVEQPGEWPLRIVTHKGKDADSFGRWLATVYRAADGEGGLSLNEELVRAGHARVFRP